MPEVSTTSTEPQITAEILSAVEETNGLHFTDAEHELMREGVQERRALYAKLRAVHLDNGVPPAFSFDPRLPGMIFETERQPFMMSQETTVTAPAHLEEVAFWPVTRLAQLIKSRQVSSVALTEMYLGRLKRYDPLLHCVITLTEALALAQARRADDELAHGHYRGPLHGIPWGAKDLLATRGIRTTWGAQPFVDQTPDFDATVVERLEAAGAVLVAKLSLGELAMDDVWFGGQTRTPWNLEEGSSGSSAGSGAATAAGLVGFAIGTETLGSIISPATRCRVSGLRPTFGRVSRHGAMALCWTMDKIGPMCRSVEDCAVVFNAIYGPDGKDLTVTDYPFNWNPGLKIDDLRIGYVPDPFPAEEGTQPLYEQALDALRSLGAQLIPITLPELPLEAITILLFAEAAAAFDELTRSNQDDMLARQLKDSWPNLFRQSRLIPAVEYIQANRVRTLLMRAMAEMMDKVDVYAAPNILAESPNLVLTNLTGNPSAIVPSGVTASGKAFSMTFTGRLYGEANILAVAKAYQDATDYHLKYPTLSA